MTLLKFCYIAYYVAPSIGAYIKLVHVKLDEFITSVFMGRGIIESVCIKMTHHIMHGPVYICYYQADGWISTMGMTMR